MGTGGKVGRGARLGLLRRGPAGDRAEGPWVSGRSPLDSRAPCQFGEGIKKFLFNYFLLKITNRALIEMRINFPIGLEMRRPIIV